MKTGGNRLILEIEDPQTPKLERTEFWLDNSVTPARVPEAHNLMGWKWKQGEMGFALYFIAYKLWGLAKSTKNFSFKCELEDGPGASFANALENPTWIKQVFAAEGSGNKDKVYQKVFVSGNNRSGRNKQKPRLIKIFQEFLPSEAITINWDGKLCGTLELKKLEEAIRDQWQPHHNVRQARTGQSSPAHPSPLPTIGTEEITAVPDLPQKSGVIYDSPQSASLQLREEVQTAPKMAVPNNLPRQELAVVGRDEEIGKILQVLAKSYRLYLVSITGVGGVGKTALALEVAHRCLNRRGLPKNIDSIEFAFDAIVWTSAKQKELDGNAVRLCFTIKSNLPSIIREILKVAAPEKMGALPPEERQREIALELLREKRILLVVDNMETVEDETVLSFLCEVPTPSKVIITDRRAVHESRSLPLTELSIPDAIRLIHEQCNSEILHGRLNLNDEQVKSLAEKTGGIPLAIIWALGRIAATGSDPSTVIRRLADAGSTPVLGFLFEESYRLISPNSKKLLAVLALPGTPVVGEMLGDWLNLGRSDVEDALDELKQFALIRVHLPAGNNIQPQASLSTIQKTYRIISLAVEYIRSRKIQLDDACRNTIGEKLFRFVKGREDNIDWPSIATIDLIDEHHELLAWGVEDAFDKDQHQLVVQMVRAIGYALGIRGNNVLRLRLGKMAVHSAKTIGSQKDIARALITNVGWIHFFWSEYDKCLDALQEGLVAARADNDLLLVGMGLRLTAQVSKERNNLEEAKKLLQEALNIFKTAGDDYQLAITLGTWGSLHRDMRDYNEAESSMREALRIASRLKNSEELQSVQCQKLTKIMIELKRLPEAEEFNARAETILVQLRRQVGVAYCKLNRARIAEQRGDIKQALEYAKEAETLFVQFGDRREIAADLQRIQEKAARLKSRTAASK